MTPRIRKLTITAHVAFSVGWLGASATFLALSLSGLTSHDAEVVRSAYLSMNVISKFVIIPMSFAALITGLIQALCTPWGLFRYYWILMKFGLAVFATLALLVHQFVAVAVAAKHVSGATPETLLGADLNSLKIELVRAPGLAVLLLLAITTLGVYKPWGLTRYGQRKQQEHRKLRQESDYRAPLGLRISLAIIGILALLFIILHITGHGFGNHSH